MLTIIDNLIAREEAFLPRFARGTSQHSLLVNRLDALRTVRKLLTGEETPSREELQFAALRIESMAGKLEKALYSVGNDTTRMRCTLMLQALRKSQQLLEQAIARMEMTWLDEVREKARRRNQSLFQRDSLLLQPLACRLLRTPKAAVVAWALACAEDTAADFARRHPRERLLQDTIDAARSWARGEIRLPAVRSMILACHALAKTMSDPSDADRCHAVAQACSTIHTDKHALGLPMYELTAIVRDAGLSGCSEAVEARVRRYMDALARLHPDTGDDDPV